MKNGIFYLGIAMLFTHEMDAMPNHEWRVLPLVRALGEDTGMTVFVAMHVPIFALIVGLVASTVPRIRRLSRVGVAGFLVLHGVLHALFMSHGSYEFSSLMSNALIFGAAGLGALFLLFDWRASSEGPE